MKPRGRVGGQSVPARCHPGINEALMLKVFFLFKKKRYEENKLKNKKDITRPGVSSTTPTKQIIPGGRNLPSSRRHFESQGPFMEEMALQDLTDISAMTDEVYRTRSQKRAMERDGLPNDVDMKKPKMECSQGTDMDSELEELKEEIRIKTEPVDRGGGRTAGLLKGPGEVKATIKVEVPTGDEPVDMSTSKM